ncbi:hypothetical protein ABEY43_06525 [Priestia megaterium]
MGGRKKHTIEEVRDYLQLHQYTLVSTEYHRHTDKLDMICSEGHDCSISFKNFKNNKRCRDCGYENSRSKQRKPIEEICDFIESHGSKLIEWVSTYENSHSELVVKCKNGHVHTTSVNSLYSSKCGCSECRNQYLSIVKREDGNKVYSDFEANGLIPKFDPKDYINAKQNLPYICPNHIDEGIKYITYYEMKKAPFKCKSCYLDNNKGENHWNWQGGVSSLNEYLRAKLNNWKFLSLKRYEFKCALTGIHTKDLEIHHLHNFRQILDETLEKLKIGLYKDVSEYTSEELHAIVQLFLDLNNSYGLGIPLQSHIHTLFHMSYGYSNNTPEQFEEFINDWNNKKYENFLMR